MGVACFVLAGLALFLESVWRAPEMDDNGRIVGPSMRDEARAERRRRRRSLQGNESHDEHY